VSPKLVACDVDGTVLRSDGTISPRTRDALALVEDSGAALVFASGRPPRWMRPLAEQTGHRGVAICANGAIVYDLHDERIIDSYLLDAATLREAIQALRERIPGALFAVEYGASFAYEEGYVLRAGAEEDPDVAVVDADKLGEQPAAKLLLRHASRESDELLEAARDVLQNVVEVTHSTRSGPGLLEISALGVSKASALARLCEERGVPAEQVLAFGDMPNDLPMLAWAGTAYAMGNAHPAVLAAVDRHTLSNDEEGVALILERVFG
jgi:Cof subfamily protein (haloacid dehalogenase superfamily)